MGFKSRKQMVKYVYERKQNKTVWKQIEREKEKKNETQTYLGNIYR